MQAYRSCRKLAAGSCLWAPASCLVLRKLAADPERSAVGLPPDVPSFRPGTSSPVYPGEPAPPRPLPWSGAPPVPAPRQSASAGPQVSAPPWLRPVPASTPPPCSEPFRDAMFSYSRRRGGLPLASWRQMKGPFCPGWQESRSSDALIYNVNNIYVVSSNIMYAAFSVVLWPRPIEIGFRMGRGSQGSADVFPI